MKKNTENKAVETTKTNDLLEMYRDQTITEGKHDYHIDGFTTYGDYSDSCCC